MLNITVICVGKLKEKFYISAVQEYQKRLLNYCKLNLIELPEERLPDNPSQAQIENALNKEALSVTAKIPKNAAVIAMCIEGKMLDSVQLSQRIAQYALNGSSNICFVIGSSYGLSDSVKKSASLKLSMSPMTFPHHLARVMLLEQIYRSFKILEGSRYHK